MGSLEIISSAMTPNIQLEIIRIRAPPIRGNPKIQEGGILRWKSSNSLVR
jgi:hypothetical protein